MSAAALGLGTATALAVGAAARRLSGQRPGSPAVPSTDPPRPGPLEHLGAVTLRWARLPDPGPIGRRRAGTTCVAAALVAPILPPLAVAVLGIGWVRSRLRGARTERARRRAVADGLPEAVDLLLLCCGAGVALPLALPLVAGHIGPPIGPALDAAERAADAGRVRADALTIELGGLGDRAVALGQVLADHLRYGVALGPALERLGLELRLDRRRRAEQDARRVPIKLLGPLITCVLPAFGLLTVVPLLAASLRSLPT